MSRYDGQDFTTFTTEDGLAHNRVMSIFQDREGHLWFGTQFGGVSRYDGREFTRLTTEDGLAHNRVMSIFQDREGYLWFGTSNGVSRYDGQEFSTFTALGRQEVRSLLLDQTGCLWFAVWGGGVNRYDGREFSTFTAADGLAGNQVFRVFQDQMGFFWLSTVGGGVSRYDGKVFQTVTLQDGLGSNTVNSIFQDRDGFLWFGTTNGVTRYHPPISSPPPIFIDEVVADRRYENVSELSIPSSVKLMTFKFHGMSYKTRPGAMVYLYRLEGYDEEWQQTRAEWVEYTDLPVGRYEFQVKAVDRDLNYSEEPATVSVDVYYQPVSSSIRISEPDIQDVFASFYKIYIEEPVGSVLVINDDPTQIEATLSFYIPDHMSRPTEQTVLLGGQSSQIVSLYAILEKEILDLEGAIPAQAEVSLSCELGQQMFSIRESKSITVYGRGALTWDNLGRAAAFITPEDHSVAAFSRSLFEKYRSRIKRRVIDGNIPTAMLLFEALNAHGIKYARGASTPYSQVRGNRSAVDNIQYPGELLRSKMGDCDDCTVLYCALLEFFDIPTALIDHPNHILMMFDSGVREDRFFGFSLDEYRYVERGGRFWIPVEVTKLGEGSFMDAWELGARTWQRLQDMDELVTDVRGVWSEYPYALPSFEEEIKPPDSEELERAFIEDMAQLQMIRERYIERTYIRPLLENPGNHRRRLELGYTLLEADDYNNAISALMHLLDTSFAAEAYNLIAICYAGREDYEMAIHYMEKAVESAPELREYKRRLEALEEELSQ